MKGIRTALAATSASKYGTGGVAASGIAPTTRQIQVLVVFLTGFSQVDVSGFVVLIRQLWREKESCRATSLMRNNPPPWGPIGP